MLTIDLKQWLLLSFIFILTYLLFIKNAFQYQIQLNIMNFNNSLRKPAWATQQKYRSLDRSISQQNNISTGRSSKHKFNAELDSIKQQITAIINHVARKKHENINALQEVQCANMDLLQYFKQQKKYSAKIYPNTAKILYKQPKTDLYETRKPNKSVHSPYVNQFNIENQSHPGRQYSRQDLLKQNQMLKMRLFQENKRHIQLLQENQYLQDQHLKLRYLVNDKNNLENKSQISTKPYITKQNNLQIQQIKNIKQKINHLEQSINSINKAMQYQ